MWRIEHCTSRGDQPERFSRASRGYGVQTRTPYHKPFAARWTRDERTFARGCPRRARHRHAERCMIARTGSVAPNNPLYATARSCRQEESGMVLPQGSQYLDHNL